MPLSITEFSALARDSEQFVLENVGREPALATQNVAIGASSTQSAPLNASTRFVRINASATCRIAIGANPTADANSRRISANATEVFHIPSEAGGTFRIAVITST